MKALTEFDYLLTRNGIKYISLNELVQRYGKNDKTNATVDLVISDEVFKIASTEFVEDMFHFNRDRTSVELALHVKKIMMRSDSQDLMLWFGARDRIIYEVNRQGWHYQTGQDWSSEMKFIRQHIKKGM